MVGGASARISAVVILGLAACNNNSAQIDASVIDASVDARVPDARCDCAPTPVGVPACGPAVCGNDVHDECLTWSPMDPCGCATKRMETCDGDTCSELGFYGSAEVACNNYCLVPYVQSCSACGPDASACIERPYSAGFVGLAAGDVQIAVVAPPSVELYDNLLNLTTTVPIGSPYLTLTPTTTGWLASQSNELMTLSRDGVVGPIVTSLPPSFDVALSPVIDGHILVAWTETVAGQSQVSAAIVNESGTLEVAAWKLFASDSIRPAITTDGVDFLVAGGGHVARVTTTGVTSVFANFPFAASQHANFITWNGDGGFHVTTAFQSTYVKRFDAMGAPQGPTLMIPQTVRDVVAAGPNLQVVVDGAKLHLVEIDGTTGSVTIGKEIGAVDVPGSLSVIWQRRLVKRSSDLVVVWTREGRRQLALATP